MKTYAMVLGNTVIGVLPNQNKEPYWPPDFSGTPVVAIPCDENVKLGMDYLKETGEFTFSESAVTKSLEFEDMPLTQNEEIMMDMALNMEYMISLLEPSVVQGGVVVAYTLLKNKILRGSYERESLLGKMDVFLLCNRISEEQYKELMCLMK